MILWNEAVAPDVKKLLIVRVCRTFRIAEIFKCELIQIMKNAFKYNIVLPRGHVVIKKERLALLELCFTFS